MDDILGRAGQGNRIVPDGGRTDAIVNDPMTGGPGKLTSNEANYVAERAKPDLEAHRDRVTIEHTFC